MLLKIVWKMKSDYVINVKNYSMNLLPDFRDMQNNS